MLRSIKVYGIIIATLIALISWVWPYFAMEFVDSAHYTQQDKREYSFFTPDILKKMPRISQQFDFDYANVSGPAKHIHAVKFYNSNDISLINSYLEGIGYTQQKKCDLQESLCWRGVDAQETIYVSYLRNEQTVIVQVVYDFT